MAVANAPESTSSPTVTGFSHISLPVRDIAEAVRFWTAIFQAEPVRNNHPDRFAEVRVGGMVLGLSKQPAGWTAANAEFPHYAFFVQPQVMKPLKQRLESFGVPTHSIWTRNRKEALMYFRDPSGNLFELYCEAGFPEVNDIPLGVSAGGDYEVDFQALTYNRWRDPAAE
jgi:catechol 2,3-dioxygenase-like lactoylglutathione lyase family enzyme